MAMTGVGVGVGGDGDGDGGGCGCGGGGGDTPHLSYRPKVSARPRDLMLLLLGTF
jgi:hypothetical protein